jgi:DNA (cytosine-5)-methyltransferase 1
MKTKSTPFPEYTVMDLFSGGGGMSYGFHAHPSFKIIAAADAEIGKPSYGEGSLECNSTYQLNIGVTPAQLNLATTSPEVLKKLIRKESNKKLTVLISCAPCTGFSRMRSANHISDDPRNSLVTRSSLYVEALKPEIFVMENARELISGKFNSHFHSLATRLKDMGYVVNGSVHFLSKFGLPQKRERALIIACRPGYELHTIDELWDGYEVAPEAVTVRNAISRYPKIKAGETHHSDCMHVSPSLGDENLHRISAIPLNGGSWADLRFDKKGLSLMTPAMKRYVECGDFGSHPDVYGRMSWEQPAPTIKRECSHIGNGRYAHPEQNRLCSVRELATLQGFPENYQFAGSVSNMYRHVGDAVPPLISFQLAWLCHWMLSGEKPRITDIILANTSLKRRFIRKARQHASQYRLFKNN